MKKINLDQKLSKKATTVFIVALVCFVIASILAAAIGGSVYFGKQDAKITNYSSAKDAALRLRNDGTLVYVYESPALLSLSDLIDVSKGSDLFVLRAETVPDGVAFTPSKTIDLSIHPHAQLLLQVKNPINGKTTDYILEIVSKTEYQPDKALPVLIGGNDGPILQNIE